MEFKDKICCLSTAYWGPIQYFTKFLSYQKIHIEICETYPKQTYRNRCVVYGPNGIQTLQVPVESGSFHKILTRDLKIAYHMPWQKNHISTIQTIYRSAPFYEYYIDDIIPIYEQNFIYLIDLNQQITQICLKWLKLQNNTKLTEEFNKSINGDDFRYIIHPKQQKNGLDENFKPIEYHQVFNDRLGFIPNLSILDLVMNCGPDASNTLKVSSIPLP